jgi:hypothetical protein
VEEGSGQPTTAVSVANVKPVTPQNEALLEAGKAMFLNSLDVGRDFCKTMITVCSAAIPVHVALVGLAAGKEFNFHVANGALALAGPALYLGALSVFAYGYFPSRGTLSVEDVDSIEKARVGTINRRYDSAQIGTVVFVLGVVMTLVAAMYFFSLPDPAPAAPMVAPAGTGG